MSPSSRVEAVAERSELVRQALETSLQAHAGAVRDVGDEVPFVEHPLAVAELLAENELGDELIAAGLLHDTLEYTDLDLGSLRERFGMKVAMIVCASPKTLESRTTRSASASFASGWPRPGSMRSGSSPPTRSPT